MALRIIQEGVVMVIHWSTMQRLLSGPTQIHRNAILVEIPDKVTHEQRLEYYEKAKEIIKEAYR